MTELSEYRAAALSDVNRIRREFDLIELEDLRPGRMRKPCDCPISRSLEDLPPSGGLVSTGAASVGFFGHKWALSLGAQRFVRWFDLGRFPDLVERDS